MSTNKEEEPQVKCKSSSSTIKSPDEIWADTIKYGGSTIVLLVSMGLVMFLVKGLNGGGWASNISFLSNVYVRYTLFGLVICVLGSLIGVVNGKAYDSIVMGLGLFIGLSLLNKNSFDIGKASSGASPFDTPSST